MVVAWSIPDTLDQTMIIALQILNWLLPMLYLAALIRYGSAFFLKGTLGRARGLLPVIIATHLAFLLLLALHLHRPVPVSNYEVISVMALLTAGVYLLIERSTGDHRSGVFVLAVVLVLQYTSSVFLPQSELAGQAAGQSEADWARLHILPSLAAYVALTVSAIYAAIHLAALRDLKHRRFGVLFDRLPPLDKLSSMNWHAIVVGFIFMTLAVASGVLMVLLSHAQHSPDAKILSKIIAGGGAWIIYGVVVLGRYIGKWPMSKVSALALLGFAVVVALLVASTILS